MRSRAASPTHSPPFRADVRLLFAALLLLQGPRGVDRPELRAGLDTLYGGGFPAAAGYFAELARHDSADPAPVIFEATAYIWWAAALENDGYEMTRIDSLLDRAIARAVAAPRGPARDFWLATALGADMHAGAPYYGVAAATADVSKIKAPLLVHLAENDSRVNETYPTYEQELKKTGARYEIHMYPGTQHGFHNNSTPRYNEAAAKLSWDRTVAFFKQHLA